MPDVLVIWTAISMVGGFYLLWSKGPYVSKGAWRMSPHAIWRARRAEIIRLAKSNQAVQVPHLSRLPADERFILSIPVFLYESRSRKPPFPAAMRMRRDIVWRHVNRPGAQIIITLVDSGTLMLTHRRIIFTSSRRRREFLLGELTHVSAKPSGIAFAARGRFGVSYFTGIDATTLAFRVTPEGDERWKARDWSGKLSGQDIQAMVNFLQRMPLPYPT